MKTSLTLFFSSVILSHGAVLSGTGVHLPILGPHVISPAPGVPHSTVVTGGTWTGTWTTPAATPWHGTFSAVGPTTGSGSTGVTRYDFSGLSGGVLPVGTLFLLGDMDSAADQLDFRAWDSSSTLLTLWMDDTNSTYGNGNGGGGAPAITDMPTWTYNAGPQQYHFDGSTRTGPNPNLGVVLTSNQPIAFLEVIKGGTSHGFSLRAPIAIPEPSTVLLSIMAGALGILRRKRS